MDITFDFDPDVARIKRAYDTQDDIGSIIRVHYEIERCLSHIMPRIFRNPKKLGASRVGPKLERLEAVGYTGPVIELAKAIDDIRNGVAHRDREELAEADIERLDAIFTQLPSKCPLAKYKIHLWGNDVSYADMLLRQKFCVYGGTAVMGLASLPHETEAKIKNLLGPTKPLS